MTVRTGACITCRWSAPDGADTFVSCRVGRPRAAVAPAVQGKRRGSHSAMHRSRTVGWLVGAAEIAATSAASQDVRRLNRLQLRLLDACLDELENAHERDESTLNEALARKLRPYVPAVCPGMSITD